MRKLAVTLALITLFTAAHAQRKKIDSLKKLIAASKEDTSQVSLLIKLVRFYDGSKPDSTLLLAQQVMRISKKAKFLPGQVHGFNVEGNVYNQTGNYPKALSCYLSALKINEQIGDRAGMATSLERIALVYNHEHDYRQSITFTLKARVIDEAVHNEMYVADDLVDLGDAYEKLNRLDSALIYTEQSYKLGLKIRDRAIIGVATNNLGNIYSKKHALDTALYYYRKAIKCFKQTINDDGLCETTLGMSKIFRQLGRPDSSLYYARQSIAVGWRSGFTVRVLNASQFLTTYFKEQGRLDSAFHYQEMSITAKDSLFNQEKTEEFQNLGFAERQRQQDIEEKETAYRASVRYYLLTAVIVFLLVMAFVFWKNNKQNKKAKTQIQHTLDELKITQNQLVQREKMASLGELTAGIAHEIQNPLNFVNNFSEVNEEMIGELKEELKNGNVEEALAIAGDIGENEKKIRHHGKRADFIVKGMLEHSRTSTGEKQLTNINILADEFFKLSYHGLRAKDKEFNAELITRFDTGLPKVNVAQQDLGRVLINLFSNAFYAVNQKSKTAGPDYKPTVEISTTTKDGQIEIRAKDNGNGIPDAIKDKIMQPFFTTKPAGKGTGLGLSLSYDIVVKGHGGSITVDTKEGEFTEFIVRLPIS